MRVTADTYVKFDTLLHLRRVIPPGVVTKQITELRTAYPSIAYLSTLYTVTL